MNWNKLFSMQKDLDTYISNQHRLQQENLFEERILALLVELGELANETRSFKFWSEKPPSDKSIILEEYVDNIHFLLSLGLEKGYAFSEIHPSEPDEKLTNQLNHVFAACIDFYKGQTEVQYLKMFQDYLGLARQLGFSEEEIMKAYEEKNEVNYARQQNGY